MRQSVAERASCFSVPTAERAPGRNLPWHCWGEYPPRHEHTTTISGRDAHDLGNMRANGVRCRAGSAIMLQPLVGPELLLAARTFGGPLCSPRYGPNRGRPTAFSTTALNLESNLAKAYSVLYKILMTNADNDLGKAELEFVGSLAAPFFWILRNSSNGRDLVKSGSLFFLDTGKRLFAVTAAHVVQECLNDTRSPLFLQAMIGANGRRAIGIQLGDRIIQGHPTMDIATFHVTREEVAFTTCTPLTGFQREWPPRLAQINCGVTYCGFPGVGRRSFGCIPMACIVTSVHERCISIQIERQNLVRVLGDEDMPENFDFGGMSGGPLLSIVERGSLRGWAPAGVVFQGPNPSGDSAQSIEGLEIIKARPIDFINADGTLDLARWEQTDF
jgi:hypothetical protein